MRVSRQGRSRANAHGALRNGVIVSAYFLNGGVLAITGPDTHLFAAETPFGAVRERARWIAQRVKLRLRFSITAAA